LEAKRRKEFELAGRAVLQGGKQIPKPQNGSFTIEAAVADFLEFTKIKKRPNTHKRYRAVLDHFRAFAKPYTQVGAISPPDIDAYRDERLAEKNTRGKPISPRNVNYEVATIRSFCYYLQKFRDPSLPNPAARLKSLAVTKTIVDTYDEAELEKFLQACTKEEQAIFKTFYYTGLREQELAHLHWSDLSLVKGVLTVRAKPEEGFIPKDWEEREIPLHPSLVTLLKKLPRRHADLVFPTLKGNPNGHLLRMLKEVVERAKLRGHWYLHKFRKTLATRALEKGANIRTVQALLGHKNITTTARYLSTSTDKMRQAVAKL
jgi:integrase